MILSRVSFKRGSNALLFVWLQEERKKNEKSKLYINPLVTENTVFIFSEGSQEVESDDIRSEAQNTLETSSCRLAIACCVVSPGESVCFWPLENIQYYHI